MPEDILTKITTKCAELRNAKLELKNLEERVDATKQQIRSITREDLPDMMAQAGVPKLHIAAEGNHPAYEIKVAPFAYANVPVSWPEEKRQEAFDWLDENGHGDLIKTEIVITFNREERAAAQSLINDLRAQGIDPFVHQTTHWATLSKWLKETISRGLIVPLDLIGGEIGREAKIKEID